MLNNYVSLEDFKQIRIGQSLKVNARYEDLRRGNWEIFPFVAKREDVVIVKRNLQTHLIVSFQEDMVPLSTKNREVYGEFIVERHHIQLDA